MTKSEISEILREQYALNEPLDEETFKENHERAYREIMRVYNDWEKALHASGIINRRLKERDKYMLYLMMKTRVEAVGEEALRPKNIDVGTKTNITNLFKTLRNLQDAVKGYTVDSVMYDARSHVLTGGDLEQLETQNPELFQRVQRHYDDIEDFRQDYHDRFGLHKVVERGRPADVERDAQDLIAMICDLGFFDENLGNILLSASQTSFEEIMTFLFEEMMESRKTGKPLDEAYIQSKNPVMYYAIRARFGSLEDGFEAASKSWFVSKAR